MFLTSPITPYNVRDHQMNNNDNVQSTDNVKDFVK